jgi:hypothetical protein
LQRSVSLNGAGSEAVTPTLQSRDAGPKKFFFTIP